MQLSALAAVLAVLALARAAPTPDEIVQDELRLAIYETARQTGQTPREVARQLIGGGDAYKPYQVPCPDASSTTWVRAATGLGSGETNYLSQRKPYLETAIKTQVASHGIAQPPRTPVIGFALSGGGYRAMQVGLGGVMATMNASAEAAASGTGGWFDGVTYMAGLSGGSWATGTLMANDGQMPTSLVDNVWNLESNLVVPDDNKLQFYYDLISNVRAKANQGFPTQITDYWGLALGNHLLPSQYHLDNSPNYTYSSLPSTVNGLKNGSLPMPIIIAAEREPGELVVAENATVWELTPWEFGAWAFGNNTKVQGAFTPMEYLGTSLSNGQPNSTTCWKGFDQLSFVMGTSSTLFNAALVQLTTANASGIIVDAIEGILQSIGEQENDIARYPNSFAGWNSDNNPITDLEYLTLVDAGETNQNLPIEPLLIPYRGVDAILAFDSSADTEYSWPNGSALRTTYERAVQLALQQDVGIRMPRVPSTNGFVNGGYNTRPTFFGCEANGTTPIIVYVPNYPWSYYGNTSTFQLAYEEAESEAVITNGMRSLTLNGTVASWPKCLTCALTDRAFNYTTANRTAECQACFDTWCWDGTDNDTTPSTTYAPVVGQVPQFLVQKNLVKDSSGSPAPSASTASPAATSSAPTGSNANKSSGAATRTGAITGVMSIVALGSALLVLL